MKPELKNLLLNLNGQGQVSRKQLITQDSQNDLVNTRTLNHYIGSAFSTLGLPDMDPANVDDQSQDQNKELDKEEVEQQSATGKESRQSSDRFSGQKSKISDTGSVKAFKAKEYFKKV